MSADNSTQEKSEYAARKNERRPGKRRREEGMQRRIQVAQMMRLKIRPHEMAKQLNVGMSAIYEDLRILRKETTKWFYDQAKNDLMVAHKLSIEVLEERQRKAMLIEADPSVKAFERLEASKLIAEIEISLWNMLPYTKMLMQQHESMDKKSLDGRTEISPKNHQD